MVGGSKPPPYELRSKEFFCPTAVVQKFLFYFFQKVNGQPRTKVPTVNYLLRHDLHLFQAENLRRFGQQVSDSDGSVLVARNRGADLHVVRRCANFNVIDGGEWCISA